MMEKDVKSMGNRHVVKGDIREGIVFNFLH